MDTTTSRHQPKTGILVQKSLVTDIVATTVLVACAPITSGITGTSVVLVVLGGVIFLSMRHELLKKFPPATFDVVRACYLTVFSVFISNLSNISPLLLIIPALIALLTSRGKYVWVIPGLASLIAAVVMGQVDNAFFWVIWLGCVVICAMIQGSVAALAFQLHEQHVELSAFRSDNIQHLNFVKAISADNYLADNPFAKGDTLGTSLFDMSLKFKKAAEEEKLHSWKMGGLNDIGTILRASSDVTANYNKLISFLVRYLHANQGGLFTINASDSSDIHVELKACYAYEKHKILQKKQNLEDGLIGQSIQEKEMVYVERIPENYVHITSGLGLATPRSLVIVPLKNGDDVVGVIEIASFNTLEKHEREFLESAADIIGAAIQSFQNNIYTKKMLAESQQLAEELKSQQEEVRQNLEELEATQEHLTREAKEREKLETELKKSKEFLNLVLDSVPIPVFVKDRKHKMILLNKAVCDLNNMSKDQMLGKSDYDFFTKEEADVFWNFEEDIFNSKTAAEKVEHAVRNGRETYTIDKKLVVTTDDGEDFMVGINIDVTYAKMMEEQLKNEANMLVRTRRDIKRLADIVVKEIGSPLQEIKALTHTVSQYQHVMAQDDACMWEEVDGRITRMQSLIDAIANYFEFGTTTQDVMPFHTRKIIEDVIRLTKNSEHFAFDLDGSLPVLSFPKSQMYEVFSVLIKNAVEHQDKISGKICVKVNQSDKLIQFAVLDDGPGIKPEKQETIFDVFSTLKFSNDKFALGSGLTFAKKIIEENGGSLWFEPNGRRGSKFVFNLPIHITVNTK